MSKYYGIERSEAYLQHYGIKGMKWGMRKARESIRSFYSYRRARAKLQRLTADQKRLKNKAGKALSRMNDAEQSRKDSKFGKLGLGKEAWRYRRAKWKFACASGKYYDSLTSDQYKRLRNRLIRSR